MTMGIYKVEAIVLRSRIYGEADRILTLFTLECGKISAIAKGVRKPTSRLRGAVQLFCHSHFVLYSGKSLDTVTQGEARETFHFLQNNLLRLTTASYCAELVDCLTMERQPLGSVFHLLLNTLRCLEQEDPEVVARVFETKLLAVLGYRPRLDRCVSDDHKWQVAESEGPVWFSVEKGGVLCPACACECSQLIQLTPVTVKLLGYFLQAPFARAVKVKIPKESMDELESLLRSYITYHGEVNPRSREFLETLLRKNSENSL
jgi:DNA repair protein RecO (recombination protein O)